jgi:hypothetical protein
MRMCCELLACADRLPIRDETGCSVAALSCQRLVWRCRDGQLDLRILAPEPLPLPEPEASEPVASALGRLHRAVAGSGALLLLANPAACLGPERISLAAGIRLFGIASDADLAC